jgi:predicted acylesterase/phospholipase RssA
MKRILSIAGGGMRGVLPAKFLVEIDLLCGEVQWDMIAGVSTGSIVGACLASGLSPHEILSFYYQSGPEIFSRAFWQKPMELFCARYSGRNLCRELCQIFGTKLLTESPVKLLIAATDADSISPVWLRSWGKDAAVDWSMVDAVAASCSAQTYFPSYRKNGVRYIDGGNHSNNPSAFALQEAKRLWPDEKILVVHIGTGQESHPCPLPEGGLMQWGPIIFGEMSALQDRNATTFCNTVADCYLRLDVSLDRFPSLDDASKGTLDRLVSYAEGQIGRNPLIWRKVAELLK